MSLTVDIARATIGILIPPKTDASPEKVYHWRLAVAGGVMFLSGSLATHIALACGFLPTVFSGFAAAGDVTDVKNAILAMRADTLRGQIMETVKDQCNAHEQKNYTAERAATDRKYGRIDEYRKVTGRNPDVPQCWELP